MTPTETPVAEPVVLKVTRYRCPFCTRSRSSKAAIRPHIPRCWHNPAGRGCGICEHYLPAYDGSYDEPGEPEGCAIDLSPQVPASDEDRKHTGDEYVTVRNCPGWEPEP